MRWESETLRTGRCGSVCVCGRCTVLDHSKQGRFPGSLPGESGTPLWRDRYRNDKDELWEEIKIPEDNEGRKLRVRLVAKDTKT